MSSAPSAPHALNSLPPSVLIVSTVWWPLSARLAVRLRNLGASVSAIVPPHHMMHAVRGLADIHELRALSVVQSLDRAIAAASPDLILPADDTAVWLLHDLAQRRPEMLPLVERSLGRSQHFPVLRSRRAFLELAQSLAIPCPAPRVIRSSADIQSLLEQGHYPTVLKYDGTSGGYGVVIAHNAEQLSTGYRMLLRHRLPLRRLKRLCINGDITPLFRSTALPADEITQQIFLPGTPANGLFVANQGRILTHLQVRAVRTLTPTGAAVVVDRIFHPAILSAAQKLAAHLELSGFFGLDFILHEQTGDPWLLEINPRATQLCTIPLDPATISPSEQPFATLADAALSLVLSKPLSTAKHSLPVYPRFAFFPQAHQISADDPALATAVVDRPEDEPELAAELLRPVWPDRRPWLSLYNRLMRRVDHR